ncbi:hypothetical protein AHiyo8_52220 [Arthrobacter sp. Hiyo8]|nr:hypothetical protein AHiyo8_52220 [Arthrobacter sp. Hiyo8]
MLLGKVMGSSQHDRLADAAGTGEDGQESRGSGTELKAIFEFIQESGAADDFRWGGSGRRPERVVHVEHATFLR